MINKKDRITELERQIDEELNKDIMESLFHLLFNDMIRNLDVSISFQTNINSIEEIEDYGIVVNDQLKQYLDFQESPMFEISGQQKINMDDIEFTVQLQDLDPDKTLLAIGMLLGMTTCNYNINPKV